MTTKPTTTPDRDLAEALEYVVSLDGRPRYGPGDVRTMMQAIARSRAEAIARAERAEDALSRIVEFLKPVPAEGNMASATVYGIARAALAAAERSEK